MLSKYLQSFVCVAITFFAVFSAEAVIDIHDFDSEAQRERYQYFIEVLRCPKCQNQNLAGSNSPIAEDLRNELYRLLKEGNSDQQVKDFMVARYGDFVLYEPAFNKNTYFLWVGPLAFLFLGLLLVLFVVKGKKNNIAGELQPSSDEIFSEKEQFSEEEQQRLSRLLGEND